MGKNHNERLALWKQKQQQLEKAQFRLDIERIVRDIDRRLYADYRVAEPSAKQRTRISGRLQSAGGE